MTGVYYRLKYYLPLLLLFTVFLGSCSIKNRNALLKEDKVIPKDSLKTIYVSNPTKSYDTYTIKAFDLLYIRNLQNAGLIGGESTLAATSPKDANFRVEPDGYVNLPVIGKLLVINLTRIEATKKIEDAYREKLFNDPIIELQIASLQVSLFGDISTPGNYLLEKEDYDLIDLIGDAGGLTEESDPKNIRIIRGDRINPEIIYVNLSNINSLANPKLKLRDGDIILVQKQKFYERFNKIQSYSIISGLAISLLNTYLIIRNIR